MTLKYREIGRKKRNIYIFNPSHPWRRRLGCLITLKCVADGVHNLKELQIEVNGHRDSQIKG